MEEELLEDCIKVTEKLLQHKYASLFATPVDPETQNCPDYFEIVKNPMDMGTILTKLKEKQYDLFETFVDDMNLVFSNCLLYNQGTKSRMIRNHCNELKTLFDKLLLGVAKRHKELFVDEEVSTRWIQCDTCLKWRAVPEDLARLPRRKCGDFGTNITCDTPQEAYPRPKFTHDGNSLQTVVQVLPQLPAKRALSFSNGFDAIYQNEITASNFNSFLLNAWTCSPEKLSAQAISSKFDGLTLEPYTLYECANRLKKNWNAVCQELAFSRPALKAETANETLKSLYNNYIKPFEKMWKEFHSSSAMSSSTLFRAKKSKVKKTERKCKQCESTLDKQSLQCVICESLYCSGCEKENGQDPSLFVCSNCKQGVTVSWNEFPFCLVCGEEIKETETEQKQLCCCKCKGLVHFNCCTEEVKDMKDWICSDCKLGPGYLTSYIMDPKSRIVTPFVQPIV